MLDTEQTMHGFKSKLKPLNGETGMSYLDRDTFGMYKSRDVNSPSPALMSADTLIGNDVCNHKEEAVATLAAGNSE